MFGEREQLKRLGRREAERLAAEAFDRMRKTQALEDDYARLLETARARSLKAVEEYALMLAQLEVASPVELVAPQQTSQPRISYKRRLKAGLG